jgi:hypothetical protein
MFLEMHHFTWNLKIQIFSHLPNNFFFLFLWSRPTTTRYLQFDFKITLLIGKIAKNASITFLVSLLFISSLHQNTLSVKFMHWKTYMYGSYTYGFQTQRLDVVKKLLSFCECQREMKVYNIRAVLRRRKNSGFHSEIWLYSGILVIIYFRMKSGNFPSLQYYP